MVFLNFINGEFESSKDERFLAKESPFTGEVLGQVYLSSAIDFVLALQGAKKAAPEMKALSNDERREILLKLARELEINKEKISYQEALHQGLSQSFVFENSIEPAIRILIKTAHSLEAEENKIFRPTGVITILVSWQLSLLLMIERLAPAIAAGNAAIIKASELSPISGFILGNLLSTSGIPKGAVQILQGQKDLAEVMASHPGVQAVSAVGRCSTIESIAKSALSPFKKLQLAGASKNVSAVLGGFDFKQYFKELMESFLLGQGQLCWNSTRLLILESGAEEFYSRLNEYLSELQPLRDPLGSSVWTPLISKSRVQEVTKFKSLGLQEKGNLILVSLKVPDQGFYAAPVFFKDLTNCSVLHQDELGVPVFLINSVKYQHEMTKWIQNSYLGHSSYLWGDMEKAKKVAQGLDLSQVCLNTWCPGQKSVFGSRQSSFGISDVHWQSPFYSDVKILTLPRH